MKFCSSSSASVSEAATTGSIACARGSRSTTLRSRVSLRKYESDALAQGGRLAHVEDVALLVAEEVDARLVGQGARLGAQRLDAGLDLARHPCRVVAALAVAASAAAAPASASSSVPGPCEAESTALAPQP